MTPDYELRALIWRVEAILDAPDCTLTEAEQDTIRELIEAIRERVGR